MTESPQPRQVLDKAAFFEDIGYQPHPGQVAVHESRALRRVLACGSRWGKSTCAAAEVLAALMEPCERSLGWVVAPTFELTGRVFLRVQDMLRSSLAHRIVEFDARNRRIVVRNLAGGLSEVCAKSADHPASLLGEALDWLVVDEAARLRREIWEGHLAQRLLDRDGWALLLSTPRGKDWFYRMHRRGRSKRHTDYASWSSPTWDNPHIDKELIEAERGRQPGEVFDAEYGAEFTGEEVDPCEECGCPNPAVPRVFIAELDEEIPCCSDCGYYVDAEGRTRMGTDKHGRPTVKVVRLPVEAVEVMQATEPTSPEVHCS